MSKSRKVFLVVLVSFVLLLAAVAGGIYGAARSSVPAYSGELSFEGLQGEVKISRDERGVAYIKASNKDDLFFAQGYVHAQERLWQMDIYRKAHAGRVSELIGEDMLEMDTLTRTIGLQGVTDEIIAMTSPETLDVVKSYVRGVNAYLDEGALPPEIRLLGYEPEPWTVEDVVGSVVLVAYEMGLNWTDETKRLAMQEGLEKHLFEDILPPYDGWDTTPVWQEEQTEIYFNNSDLTALLEKGRPGKNISLPKLGSNNWVISPERSATGTAMLANDPHTEMSLPPIWFENQLEVEGEINIYGWSIPGGPGVVAGQNDNIAWGITNIGDVQDLYMEKQHPDNPYLFKKDDEWYEAEVVTEEIKVQGRDPVELEIIITRNGPLISQDPPVSFCWTGYDLQGSAVDAILNMNLAENWDDFRQALFSYTIPTQNVVYADTEGNIGFRTVGQYPVRSKGVGAVPVPGWDSDYEWDGYIPMEELPELYNPPQGYAVTANHKVTGDDYPYIIAYDYAPPYRMQRIVDVLESKEKLSVADFKELQNDWYNRHASERLPTWIDSLKQNKDKLDTIENKALSIASDWSSWPVNDPELAGPAIFQVWYLNFMEEVFRDEMGDELYQTFTGSAYLAYNALEYLLEREESPWFERGMDHMLLESFIRTVKELTDSHGDEPSQWQWQQLQQVSLEHLMGEVDILRPIFCRGPFPYGGDHMTVGRAAYSLHDPFNVLFGASMRYIAVMNPEIEAYGVLAGGQSGHFMSPHYDDQVEAWLKGEYYPLILSADKLDDGITEELIMTP